MNNQSQGADREKPRAEKPGIFGKRSSLRAPERKKLFLSPPRLFKFRFGGISDQEKINFARHLSVAIRSGLPLIGALELIAKQSPSKRFKRMVERIAADVNNGQFLAEALGRFNYIFGDFFVNMVRVGEASGNLSQTLLFLAVELRKQKEVSHKVRSAMIYPAIIFFATIGMTTFLMFLVFPKILPIFSSLRIELPMTTKFIIFLLDFFSKYGYQALGGILAAAILARWVSSIRFVHYQIDKLLLSVPVVSRTITNLTLTDFTRSLSVLLKSGMNIIDALTVTERTIHNLYYRHHIGRAIEAVGRGESIARYFETAPKLFPPMFIGMIQIGEHTGNLEENLSYLAEYYESEVDDTIKNLTSVIEPVLLLIMGLVVGFVAISIITPIYSITQGLKVGG